MKLENRFTVPVTADVAWAVLVDVERIAPCMPGATLTGREGDAFTGTVKVKLGPINLTYGGTARFVSRDDGARVAVIEAHGKETRGTGTAKATITCRLEEVAGSTDVLVETDLTITGKPAQFGRGVLADVSARLVDQFAACLAAEISPERAAPNGPAGPSGQGGQAAPASAAGSDPASVAGAPSTGHDPQAGPPSANRTGPSTEAIDVLGTAGIPVAKRVVPVLGGILLVVLAVSRWRRRHRRA
jgi:carbon monoxide dehydrogenase subunit G